MLTQKARYALHALIVLAEHGGREPMMIATSPSKPACRANSLNRFCWA